MSCGRARTHDHRISSQRLTLSRHTGRQNIKLMLFHKRQKHFNKISVVINGIEIEHVSYLNLLALCSMKTYPGILYRLKNMFSENVLFVLYNAFIVSYIRCSYGLQLCEIYSHKLEKEKESLMFYDKQQLSCTYHSTANKVLLV